MYNLDAYISDFLSDNKKLSAQGIGEFTIVNGQAPNGAPLVEFVYNKSAYTSDELVSFISEQQGKNKIVTGFDVESHLNQVKQFINIGTPWTIPGFGQLQLGRSREFEFIQQTQTEQALHERSKRKQAATEAHYQTYDVNNPATQRNNTGTVLLTLFIILALGAGGYYFYANRGSMATATNTNDTSASVTDTVVSVPSSSNMNNTVTTTQPPANNNVKKADSTTVSSAPPAAASASGYRFVLNRTADALYARKRYNQLKTYGAKVYMDSIKKDSYSVYKIYLIKNAAASDTAKLRDSLTKYYGKPVKVEAGQ